MARALGILARNSRLPQGYKLLSCLPPEVPQRRLHIYVNEVFKVIFVYGAKDLFTG